VHIFKKIVSKDGYNIKIIGEEPKKSAISKTRIIQKTVLLFSIPQNYMSGAYK